MKLRVPFAIAMTSASLALTPTAGETAAPPRSATRNVAVSSILSAPQVENSDIVSYDLFRALESGQRTHDEIQEDLAQLTGTSEPIDWRAADFNRVLADRYRLSTVATHVVNLDSNVETLFVHTLPDATHPEDKLTEYNRRLNEAEEQTVAIKFVVPRLFDGQKAQPDDAPDSQALYQFHMVAQPLERNFGFRSPEGTYDLTTPSAADFNPLGWLAIKKSTKQSELQYFWEYQNRHFDVSITPRKTDIETLTFEITVHEIDTLLTTTIVLIYEPL